MKKILLSLLALVAFNAHAETFTVTATVLSYSPNMIETTVPKNVCREERVPVQVYYPSETSYRRKNNSDALLGAIIGGTVGHQFGKGSGKDAATVAGALIGYGSSGSDYYSRPGRPVTEYRFVEKCRTVYNREIVQSGWVVRYEYNGLTGSTITQQQPSDEISVTLSLN